MSLYRKWLPGSKGLKEAEDSYKNWLPGLLTQNHFPENLSTKPISKFGLVCRSPFLIQLYICRVSYKAPKGLIRPSRASEDSSFSHLRMLSSSFRLFRKTFWDSVLVSFSHTRCLHTSGPFKVLLGRTPRSHDLRIYCEPLLPKINA